MKKQTVHESARLWSVGVFFAVACVVFLARLISLQIAGQDYYTMSTPTKKYTRTETVQALRGSIYDANGKPLVTNEYSYDIRLDGGSIPKSNSEKNALILRVISDAEALGESDAFTVPDSPFLISVSDERLTASFRSEYMETNYGKKLLKLLGELHADTDDATACANALAVRYGLAVKVENPNNKKEKICKTVFDEAELRLLFAVRTDMEMHNFSAAEPYTLLKDISVKLISRVNEGSPRGISVNTNTRRVYHYPGYASHILGRTGKISAAYVDYYASLGYPYDAVVGTSGAEAAFEKYLHGTDGEMTVVEDQNGNIIEKYVSKEPIPGNNIYLTIDIDLQIAAEEALASNILLIAETGRESGKTHVGEDASAGAIAAVNSKTGAVLALASYPTYNLATFNEDYSAISTDPLSPMFNRALEGQYEPGSTFKIGVAAAALLEGIIDKNTLIEDTGEYTYYEGSKYYPKCWLYEASGLTHGKINVSRAIEVSCNVFFYEVGRLLGIERMNEYCTKYGLGQPTGIELAEKTGILAGPAYRTENSKNAWTPGDTLQAAIGQSDNLFTPLQISMYISMIVNGGTRMNAHILKSVNRFYTNEVILTTEPSVADTIDLPDDVRETLTGAMRQVTENGSAAGMFYGFPIGFGAKTGTAQVSGNKSNNAIFSAFAPFDDPELVVTSIIEQGASGINAGYSVKDVFSEYFNIDVTPNE